MKELAVVEWGGGKGGGCVREGTGAGGVGRGKGGGGGVK